MNIQLLKKKRSQDGFLSSQQHFIEKKHFFQLKFDQKKREIGTTGK
jgi:hypothetical protein